MKNNSGQRNDRTQSNSYHSFLESLKGKMVTIYRGGPESKTGILLDVQSDFVTLYSQNNNNNNNNNNNKQQNNNNNNNNNNNQNNQNTVIYYHAQHMKSISEDSKTNSMQLSQTNDEEVEFLQAESFIELVSQLQNETVQINQGGPETKYGTLLSVVGDFLVLYTEDDGIVYFNVHHVKSICKYQNNNQSDENNENNENESQQEMVYPEYVNASDFHDVFRNMAHKWVSINRGGPEAMEGVLVENAGGHYTLVSNQEVLRIHPYHIRSISCGPKGALKQNQNNNNEEENENNETENIENLMGDHDSDSKRSGDSRRSTRRSRHRSTRREHVVKTIDYVWKGRH